ncbi:marine proteobacterial sortase target protein [Psychromonas sp. KJ10-10]|uniref:marine proteobacterial sortase target protein n=1 Tax=Psychromonas sp. KJ10-10 TaxID=3391823 RepID=UPI0039B407F4
MLKMLKNISYCVALLCSLNSVALEKNQPLVGLVFNDHQGKRVVAPLLNSDINMQINGLINRVTVKQVFKNKTDEWINAKYIFPLPDKSAVDHLRLKIGERIIEGEIKPKQQAEKIYQDAKQAGKKASLLTQKRSNIFTTDVANIAPHETVIVEIEYQDSILYRDGQFSLHYPMTITPRYSPATNSIEQKDFSSYAKKVNQTQDKANTEELETSLNNRLVSEENKQLATMTTNSVGSVNNAKLLMNITANISSQVALNKIASPYHKIHHQRISQNHYQVSLTEAVIADHDFVLSWKTNNNDQNKASFYHQQTTNHHYGQLMFLPAQNNHEQDIKHKVFNKDILFVIDTSGSMSGSSIIQAKQALQYGIQQLNDNDRFNIIDFNNKAKLFSTAFMTANPLNKRIANGYIAHLKASGETNMQDALTLALTTRPQSEEKLQQIIFITDASISNEDQLLEKIQNELSQQRLFMVGIGSAPNRYFMTRSASFGKGTYTYIGKIDEVNEKVSSLFHKISSPVLQDISITWQDGSKLDYWPKNLTDLYQNEPLQLVMKIPENQQGQSIVINATELEMGKKTSWSKTVNIDSNTNAQGISQLWAREKIDDISLNKRYSTEQKNHLLLS